MSGSKMGDWISDVLIFSAGVAGGVLISEIKSVLRAKKRRDLESIAMRSRILSDMKKHHDREILNAAFRTTEDIKSELNRSLQTLSKTVTTALDPLHEQETPPAPVVSRERPD
jgi:hypothetical protein